MKMARLTRVGLIAVALVAVTLLISPSSAVATTWNQGVGIWQWNNAGNWDSGVPGSGDTANFKRLSWAQPIGIDTNGSLLNLGSGKLTGNYNGSVEVLYDSAFLTPNSNPLGSATNFTPVSHPSLEAAAAASPMITVSEINFSKQHQLYVYHPVTVDNLIDNGSNYTFYGPVTVNTAMTLNGRGDTNDMVHVHGALNAPTVTIGVDTELHTHGAATIGTLNIDHAEAVFAAYVAPTIGTLNWNTGTYMVAADGAFPGADPLVVPAGGTLNIGAAQSLPNIPKITVPGFSLLAGDMTNMVYNSASPNYNCELQEDAIFNPRAGEPNLPTLAELGGSAILYTGISTSNDNVSVGDDGSSIYKGAANGPWYGSYRANSTQIHANPGSGDLQVVYFGAGCPQVGNNVRWYGDGTSTTANVSVINGAVLDMQYTVNQDDDYSADPTLISTFNITGEAGKEGNNILYFREGHPHIRAEQTYNVSMGRVYGTANLTGYMPGTLNLTEAVLEQPSDSFAASDGTLAVSGTTFVELSNPGNLGCFEPLGARFVYPKVGDADPGDVKAVFWGNQTYDINPAATPVLADFLQNVDICRQGYQNTTFTSDLAIGHGKFLYNTYDRQNGSTVRTSSGLEKIVYAGNAPGGETPWIGFAALLANQNIDMDVDATGAIVQVGTADPNRLTHRLAPNYGGTNGFVREVPTGQVRFQRTVLADGVRVEAGTARFDQDLSVETLSVRNGATLLMASGKTATVSGVLSGTGSWTGGNGVVLAPGATVAPGYSVGELNKGGGTLLFSDALTYQWELGDPDGAPGEGWDLVWADPLQYVGISGQGLLTIDVGDAGLTRPVTPDEIFAIAAGTFEIPDLLVAIQTSVPGWDTSGAQIFPGVADIDDNGQDEQVIFLTGLIARQGGPGPDIIPEPATLSLLGLGALALLRRRRR
ncbi:PEP-CTERM sorting domain-containing protein [Planctomycetota bacterium]